MIGKIGKSGGDFLGVLSYCKYERQHVGDEENIKVRGELIYFQNVGSIELYGDNIKLKFISEELHSVAATNTRTKKPVSHDILSFPPGESPSNEILANIVKDYANEFGLKDNSVLAYKHIDKKHDHIHIVANKIDENGKNTYNSSYNYLDMGHFARKIENKYGLQSVKQMDSLRIDGKSEVKRNPLYEQLRNHIDKMIPESKDLQSLQVMLLKKGVKTKVGNGITFIHNASGAVIKGSDLGREYSKSNLEKRINGTYETNEEFVQNSGRVNEKDILRAIIKDLAPKSRNFSDFEVALGKAGYGVRTKELENKASSKRFTSILFTKNFSKSLNPESPSYDKMITGSQLGPEFKYSIISKNFNKSEWDDFGYKYSSDRKPDAYNTSGVVKDRDIQVNVAPGSSNSGLDFDLQRLLTSTNAGQVEADSAKSRAKINAEIKRNAAGYENEFGSRGLDEMKEEKRKILKAQGKKKKIQK